MKTTRREVGFKRAEGVFFVLQLPGAMPPGAMADLVGLFCVRTTSLKSPANSS